MQDFDSTLFVTLLLVASLVAMVARRLNLPYSLALVVTGIPLGYMNLIPAAHLDPHILFTLFLPPLLFEAAINLPGAHLKASWLPIGVFALLGTVVSTFFIGGAFYLVFAFPLLVALVFGALISPTDPISVTAVLKRLGVDAHLSSIIEAESLFNDGAAVVLFLVLLGMVAGEASTPLDAVGRFFWVVLGGAAVGIATGALASFVTRAFDDHLLELMLTTVVAYGAYVAAESIHLSGVIAVVTGGLVVGNYGMKTGMNEVSRVAVEAFWEYAAFVANSIVFLLIGIQAFQLAWWNHWQLVLGAIGIVMAARCLAIYGLSASMRAFGERLPLSWQHLLVWGGLRGALSMALALGLPAAFPYRSEVISVTFGYVLFSLLIQGLTIDKAITWLGLKAKA